MRVAPYIACVLLALTGVVSGAVYPWSSDMFTLAALATACLVVLEDGPGGLTRIWPAWALLLVVCASSLWSVNLGGTLGQAFPLAGYVIFAYVVSVSASDGPRRGGLLETLFWTASLVSVYGIYQYFIGFAHTEEYLMEAASGLTADQVGRAKDTLAYRRAFSTMLSPNVLACYLAMAFPIGLFLFRRSPTGARRISYGIGVALLMFAVALTKSVGGLAAFAVGAGTYFAAAWLGGGRRVSAALAKGGALLGVALLAAAGAVLVFRHGGSLGFGWSMHERLGYWEGALNIWKASPLTGFGAGSFGALYMRYMPSGVGETRYAHDVFLHTLAETGPLGLLAVVSVFAAFIVWCARKLSVPGWEAHAPAVMAGGMAFLVHNLADYTWYVPETAVAFWLLFGLAASGGPRPAGGFMSRVAVAAFVAVLLVLGYFQARDYLAGQRASEALDALSEAGITSAELARQRPAPPEAMELATRAVGLRPYDDSLHALLAGLYEGRAVVDGRPSVERAEAEYLRAIALNPDYPYHYRDLGILYMRLGEGDKARAAFEKALSRYPSSGPLKKYLEAVKKRNLPR